MTLQLVLVQDETTVYIGSQPFYWISPTMTSSSYAALFLFICFIRSLMFI